jgi:CRP/FNR family nitrogen fixation transcriptional regulator
MQSLTTVNAGRPPSSADRLVFGSPRSPVTSPAGRFGLNWTDVVFPRNSQFYIEGDTPTYLYEIISGVARSYRMTADGRRQIVAFYVPGDSLGFEIGTTHALSTEAVGDVKVRLVKLASFLNFACHDDAAAHQLWLIVSCQIRRDEEHILQLGRTAQARVASFLLEMARRMPGSDAVAFSISRLDIADYLDLRLETVSRTLTRFARSGAIALSSRKITISNRALLTQLLD